MQRFHQQLCDPMNNQQEYHIVFQNVSWCGGCFGCSPMHAFAFWSLLTHTEQVLLGRQRLSAADIAV